MSYPNLSPKINLSENKKEDDIEKQLKDQSLL